MFNIKEMQIKTKMRKHFIPTGMARSKKTRKKAKPESARLRRSWNAHTLPVGV